MSQSGSKVGRNEPCPCASGRKYKQCCLRADEAANRRAYRAPERKTPMGETFARRLVDHRTPYELAKALGLHATTEALEITRHPWLKASVRASTIAATPEDELVASLAEMGLDGSTAAFRAAAEGHHSAWDVGLAWQAQWEAEREEPLDPARVPYLGLVAVRLWRHHLPERPCVEDIADQIAAGYTVKHSANAAERRNACGVWMDAWDRLAPLLPDTVRAREHLDQVWPNLNSVRFMIHDLLLELGIALETTTEFAERGAAFCADILARFANEPALNREDLRIDRAQQLASAGDMARAEAELQAMIDAHPDSAGAYCIWADLLTHNGRGADDPADLERAIALLERAAAVPVADPEDWELDARLDGLRALRAGKSDQRESP